VQSLFHRLKALREFERQELAFLKTLEDRDLVCEIGLRQALGEPLTVKQVFLLGLGSVPTVQRRLARLRKLGILQHRRSDADRRSVEVTLSPKALRALDRYADLLAPQGEARVRQAAAAE
jgi:hypothetical protein